MFPGGLNSNSELNTNNKMKAKNNNSNSKSNNNIINITGIPRTLIVIMMSTSRNNNTSRNESTVCVKKRWTYFTLGQPKTFLALLGNVMNRQSVC